MFAKIFAQIFNSSIAEDYVTRHIFMDLLVLADKDGVIDMTLESIARCTNVPLEIVSNSIEKLSQMDPKSRSKIEDGRRICLVDSHRDWGWQIVNYEHYRNLIDEESRKAYFRDKQREYRSKLSNGVKDMSNGVKDSQTCQTLSKEITQAEAEAEADTKAKTKPSVSAEFAAGYLLEKLPWSGIQARWAYTDQIKKECTRSGCSTRSAAELIARRWKEYGEADVKFRCQIKTFVETGLWASPEKWGDRNAEAERQKQRILAAIRKNDGELEAGQGPSRGNRK